MDSSQLRRVLLISVLGLAGLVSPSATRAESIGTSCADCPSYSGAFSIRNGTGQLIKYEYRWGTNHPWQSMALRSGLTETHSYPLGDNPNGKVPAPYVRFDNTANDGRTTWTEVHMRFHAIGYAGFGPNVNRAQPLRYHFQYSPDLRHLSLVADE